MLSANEQNRNGNLGKDAIILFYREKSPLPLTAMSVYMHIKHHAFSIFSLTFWPNVHVPN